VRLASFFQLYSRVLHPSSFIKVKSDSLYENGSSSYCGDLLWIETAHMVVPKVKTVFLVITYKSSRP
jgi:hypothetical protein